MVSIGNITFACDDPDRLRDFWIAALGYVADDPSPDLLAAVRAEGREIEDRAARDPKGVGPRLLFNKRPKRPEAPGTYIPIHLDLNADDRESEVRRLEALGATVVETLTDTAGEFSESCTVLRDPEGNGFCVQ
jgi:hypothetical protein